MGGGGDLHLYISPNAIYFQRNLDEEHVGLLLYNDI
jgi:hypothetical protein